MRPYLLEGGELSTDRSRELFLTLVALYEVGPQRLIVQMQFAVWREDVRFGISKQEKILF